MAVTLHLPILSPHPYPLPPPPPSHACPRRPLSRRDAVTILTSLALPAISFTSPPKSLAAADSPEKGNSSSKRPFLDGIVNTTSWSQYVGNGFSIRAPPQFDDLLEPEAYNGGELTYYGDKAKEKPFAARFASPDRSEIVSVVIKPSNQLKITFLEATDITNIGSLKEAAKIFVPAGATLYSARTIKVKEEEKLKTYYYYEFGFDKQHVALMAAVNSGKAFIAGATAPEMNWENDGVKLRSAAVSLSVF